MIKINVKKTRHIVLRRVFLFFKTKSHAFHSKALR